MSIFDVDKEYVAGTYSRFPVEIVRGKGSLCYDALGKEYIDMGSGIAVNIFGFCDDEWIAAVEKQLHAFQHVSNLYYQSPCALLAEQLCLRTGMKKVFFSNSGAEANECAIKVARKYGALKKGDNCYNIITMKGSFHGRTITTLAATGQDVFHKDFLPLTQGFLYASPNDAQQVINLIDRGDVSAVMMESVMGEGGVIPLEKSFITKVCDYAARKDVLVIMDEVQTGNGRTGSLYGYMNLGITPDIVTTAKGLAGGLPMGATMLGEKVKDVLGAGMHGSTFGGNPVAAAGALSVLNRLDDRLFKEINEKSKYIISKLKAVKGVNSVTGAGLMLGVETQLPAKAVVSRCIENGVLYLTAKDKIRLLPALNISYQLIDRAISVLKKVLEEGL